MDVSEIQPNCGILKPNDLLVAHDAVQAFSHGNDMMYMCAFVLFNMLLHVNLT